MTNHVHILASPKDALGITRMMQYVGRHYVPYINHTYGTSGSIWEGRYKASLVQEGRHLLTCMRYIELNPVRANMVHYPEQYPWSSYRYHAQGHPDGLIKSHPSYLGLGVDDVSRRAAYKELFRAHLDNRALVEIQAAWQTGTPFGNAFFKQKVEEKLGCKIGQPRRGRPYLRGAKGL